MTLVLSNRATSLLAAGINDSQTTLSLTSGDEDKFPVPGVGQWFPVTVVDSASNYEEMRCTGRTGVVLTVVRAQEGTIGRAFSAGARVDLRLTAGAFFEHTRDASQLSTGEIKNDVLPGRLKTLGPLLANVDDAVASGWYSTDALTTGAPVAVAGVLHDIHLNANAAWQAWRAVGSDVAYERRRIAGTWGAWAELRPRKADQDSAFVAKAGDTMTGKLVTKTSNAGGGGSASITVPHGAAPDAPVNGDLWTTTAGIFWRINGVTRQLAHLAGQTFLGKQTFNPSGAGAASMNVPVGVAPTTPVDNDIWATAAGLFMRIAGVTGRLISSLDVLAEATWITGTSTAEALISPAKARAAQAVRAIASVAVSGTTPTLTYGYNIASVVRLGVGVYQVNFTTPIGTADYGAIVGIYNAAAAQPYVVAVQAKASGSCEVQTWRDSVGEFDGVSFELLIVR